MAYVPIRGFEPDIDDTIPGAIPVMDGFLPTLRGLCSVPSQADAGLTGLTATAIASPSIHGAATLQRPDGSYRVFTAIGDGDSSQIWEASSTSWSESGPAAGYSKTANALWTFTQYGNISFAAQRGEPIQYSVSTGAFATLVGAPNATIVLTALEFIVAFDTTDATYGDRPNGWWCSAAGDYTSWTPDIATQANLGLLEETPGRVIAAKMRHSEIVAYKQRGLHVGRYVGSPVVWQWEALSEEVGTFGPHCVVSVRTQHYFPGPDGFYMFDGVRPMNISDNKVDEFFLNSLDYDNAWKIVGTHDEHKNVIWWLYPRLGDSGQLRAYIAYNYKSGRWGYGNFEADWIFNYATTGLTYEDLGTLYSTYEDLPDIPYDALAGPEGSPILATIGDGTSDPKVLKLVTGTSGTTSITTHKIGVDGGTSIVTRIRPRFRTRPTTGTGIVFETDDAGATVTTAVTSVGLSNGAFDYVRASRWQQLKQTYTGNVEILGYDINVQVDGAE